MAKKLRLRQSWCIEETIPLYDFSHLLSEEDYERYGDIDEVKVELYFWRTEADPETGTPEYVELDEFHISEDYPAPIREAAGDYLKSLDLDDLYRERVLEAVRDFYERED